MRLSAGKLAGIDSLDMGLLISCGRVGSLVPFENALAALKSSCDSLEVSLQKSSFKVVGIPV